MKGAKSGIRWGVSLLAAGLLGGLVFSLAGRPAGSSPGRFDFDLAQTVSQAAEGGGDAGASAAGRDKGFSRPFIASARAVMPAVVHIEVTQRAAAAGNEDWNQFEDDFLKRFFGQPGGPGRPMRPAPEERLRRGQGSGVIVDHRGYILTNNHVVGHADRIRVQLADKRSFDAKLVGADERSDVAVIKIDGQDLPVARLGDSAKLEIGEWVLAIGNPFGLDQTVTAGLVSAMGRSRVVDIQNEDFIQTDAAINAGNSGGPLANLDGEVVGVNTAIYSRSGGNMGIGFAIPINMARTIMRDLIERGKVTRGWLGVRPQDVTEDMAKALKLPRPEGALVAEVLEKGPASRAGIRERDVIVAFDGKDVRSAKDLVNAVGFTAVDKAVAVKLYRDGKLETVEVKVAERSAGADAAENGNEMIEKLGLGVRDLDPELRQQLGLKKNAVGVAVVEVRPDSPADRAGVEAGMLIEEVNKTRVAGVAEFKKALGAESETVLLKVRHRGGVSYLALKAK